MPETERLHRARELLGVAHEARVSCLVTHELAFVEQLPPPSGLPTNRFANGADDPAV